MDVEYTQREVIEDRLLTALTDEGQVAIVATEYELGTLIRALELAVQVSPSKSEQNNFKLFCNDLWKLREAAFRSDPTQDSGGGSQGSGTHGE